MENFLQVILLGIIEGITEFLPISSTGHLLVAEQLGLGHRTEMFNVVIQAGAICAVVLIYWRRLWALAMGWKERENWEYLAKLGLAFGVTCVSFLIIKKLGWELPEEIGPIAWALVVGGLLIFLAEYFLKKRVVEQSLGWREALLIGFSQVIAGVFPGTSRSAATIIMAMLCGVSRPKAAEFSFLLGIPTMFAASGYAIQKHWQDADAFAPSQIDDLLLGFGVSAAVAFIAVKWLLRYVQTHTFIPFGWYRVVVGLVLLVWWA